jgi:hypothetical protein
MSGLVKNGSIRETKEFGKVVGVFEANVIAINPTKDELETIYGPQEKDPEYVKEKEVKINEDGDTMMVDSVRVDVYLSAKYRRAVEEGDKIVYKPATSILKAVFYLEDREKTNKDGSKRQYINTAGTTSWVEDESDLKDWFITREYRVAKVGEDELFSFLRAWLKYDFKKPNTAFDLTDFNKFIAGDVGILKGEINGEAAQSVVGLATIRTVEKDGAVNEYQGVYNRMFLPGYNIKFFKTKKFTPEAVQALREKAPKELKPFEKFVVQITDEEYGVKDYFELSEIAPYDPTANPVANTDDAFVGGEDEEDNY